MTPILAWPRDRQFNGLLARPPSPAVGPEGSAAYAVGGIPEWIGDAGSAVPRGDESALARAVVEVLDEARWKQFSTAARRSAERFTPEAYVDRLLPILFPRR